MIGSGIVLLMACAPALQDPGGWTGGCAHKGVEVVEDGSMEAVGFVACDYGMISFEWGGVSIHWSDPVCPLMLVWQPPKHGLVDRRGSTFAFVEMAHPVAFFFRCDEDEEICALTDFRVLPGGNPLYKEMPCGREDPEGLSG